METVLLIAGVIGLFVLLLRLSRFQMEVMQTFEVLNLVHRQFKLDTMDIFYSLREVNKGLTATLERQSEIIDMINQMESQEADIEKAFQAVFAGTQSEARGPGGGHGRDSRTPPRSGDPKGKEKA